MRGGLSRRSHAGGARKVPARYAEAPPSAALAVALRTHRRGDFAAARESYLAALQEAPDGGDAWLNLGTVCVTLGRASEARRAFERGIALLPGSARAHRDAGIGLASVGAHEAARTILERAVALDAALVGARLWLVDVCLARDDDAAARAHADAAVACAPGDASAHLARHRAVFDDRDPGAAIDAARVALALDPTHPTAPVLLANALVFAGRVDEARATLERAQAGGVVSPAACDAVSYVIDRRTPTLRSFSHARRTLALAVDAAARPGAVVELGVRHGTSLRWLAATARGAVHGFDSFEGLPEAWQGRAPGAFSTAAELPDMPENVRLHPGWFEDTLAPFAATLTEPLRLLHVDSDLYESARLALDVFAPHLAPGTIVVFDEYLGHGTWRHDEHRAFQEAVSARGWRYRYLALSVATGQAAIELA